MSVIDTLTYVFKPDDKGVEKKLDDIESKTEKAKEATEALNDSFSELGKELTNTFEQVVPGSEKLVQNLTKLADVFKKIKASGGGKSVTPNIRPGGTPRPGVGGPGGGGAGSAGGGGDGGGGSGGGGGGSAALGGITAASFAAAAALAALAVGVGILTKAFLEAADDLKKSRLLAQDTGVNATQMAAVERYTMRMGLDKTQGQDVLKNIADSTRAGWIKSREFGNIFGIGNEQTQLLKRHGIRTSTSNGELRNASAIFDDITKKMLRMPRETAIGFGQFFGMTRDFAEGVRDGKVSLSDFAKAHASEIAVRARGIQMSKQYEIAQQTLTNKWQEFVTKVGVAFIPAISAMLEKTTTFIDDINKITEALTKLSKPLQDFFTTLDKRASSLLTDLVGEDAAQGIRSAAGTAATWLTKPPIIAAMDLIHEGGKVANEYNEGNLSDQEKKDREAVAKAMRQESSLNAKAANTQLEAANLMKVATARFGLTTEQYMAMWAATSGKRGGLVASGGVGVDQFGDIYRNAVTKYATPEVAEAMYFKGAPMMAQMPAQYAMGFGVTPLGVPTNAVGLSQAKTAVDTSNVNVAPAASKGKTEVNVTTGPITINTKSTDPEEINTAVGSGLSDQIKFSLSRLNDGQIA